jgi:hypothetical protein
MTPHDQLKAANDEFDAAYFGGASSETILDRQHKLMRLEELDPVVKARRLRTAAADLDARADIALGETAQDLLVVQIRRERQGADDAVAYSIERRAAASKAQAEDLAAQASALRTAANRLAPLPVAAE